MSSGLTAPGGERPLTVAELTGQIKRLVEEAFPEVWVVGEISRPRAYPSGHIYLTLKDEDATISAVIWRSTAGRLSFDPEEGMEVLVRGRLNLYPPRGQYQLDIRVMEPRGVGALQIAFEKLKEKLAAEGLFDLERKRPLPFLPRAIGVVTSPAGAAIRDIIKVLGRRSPGVPVILRPALVQGDGAAASVAKAIADLKNRDDLDVLIVGRGGGSLEDLWAFNEEPVARAIAACPIPVISAVGHEVDVTIADLVADVRAATPSAAAELAVPDSADLQSTLVAARRRLDAALRGTTTVRRERLVAVEQSWGVRRVPDRLREIAMTLDDVGRRVRSAGERVLSQAKEGLIDLTGRAEALSPLRVLARGYSVTTRDGDAAPVLDANELSKGDAIRVRLSRGGIRAAVEEIDER
jgi:exodeoxyribonuclease VII large subunit